jgi:hypothetical protein
VLLKLIWSSRKQRGPCTRVFPDREAAKLGGADRRTEIIDARIVLNLVCFTNS